MAEDANTMVRWTVADVDEYTGQGHQDANETSMSPVQLFSFTDDSGGAVVRTVPALNRDLP